MTHQITISQELVEWAHELRRYYCGDLQYCDSKEWLTNVNKLNQQIASEVYHKVCDQFPQERQHD